MHSINNTSTLYNKILTIRKSTINSESVFEILDFSVPAYNSVTTDSISDLSVTTAKLANNSVTAGKVDWPTFGTTFCNLVHGGGTITTSTLTNKIQVTLPKAGKYAIFYNLVTYNSNGGFNGEVNTRLLCGSNTSGTLTTFLAPVNWAGTSNSDVATFTTTADNEVVYLQASVNWPARGTCYIQAQSYVAYLRIG